MNLDRLQDYGAVSGGLANSIEEAVCSSCTADECDNECFDMLCRIQYDVQTEVINFGEWLVAEWVKGSVDR